MQTPMSCIAKGSMPGGCAGTTTGVLTLANTYTPGAQARGTPSSIPRICN